MSNTPEIRFNFDKAWQKKSLSSICNDIKTGKLDANAATKSGKYKFFTCSREDYKTDSYAFDGDAVIINGNGDLGITKVFSGKFNAYQRTYVLMNFTEDYKFIGHTIPFYLPNKIRKEAIGGAMPYIKIDTLNELMLGIPEIPEQKQIASFLSNADSLIDSKKKELEKTKQYKATMLYKMFPQDDKLVPEIRFKGFDGDWIDNKLIEIADFNPKSELPNTFEYVDLESVVGTKMVSHRTETILTAPSRAQRLAKYGDVFYQTVRPYQKNNYLFDKCVENYVFSTGYAQMRPKIDSQFLMSFIQTDGFVNTVLNNCTGTSFPAINPSTLSDLSIKLPINKIEQQKIGEFFTSLDSIITNQEKEIEILEHMKATLLSKMFA